MNLQFYDQHLRSNKWRDLRNRVMGRSGGWCERCAGNPADHIHHRTYERLGNEDLDDLQAVCARCHGILHPFRTFRSFLSAHLRRLAAQQNRLPIAVAEDHTALEWEDLNGEFYRRAKQKQADPYKSGIRMGKPRPRRRHGTRRSS